MEKDTINPFSPVIKGGLFSQSKFILNKLDVSYNDSINEDTKFEGNQWTSAAIDSNQLVLKDRKIIKNIVPNVYGMGAKDAVYLLESMGLRVALSGRGTVYSQSLSSGAKIAKGQTIFIQLR